MKLSHCYTLNIQSFTCQLYLNEAGGGKRTTHKKWGEIE